jgi:hypothetical protein
MNKGHGPSGLGREKESFRPVIFLFTFELPCDIHPCACSYIPYIKNKMISDENNYLQTIVHGIR